MAREKEPWEQDGKRYVASLQDTVEKCCYKDFFESDTFEVAKQACDDAAEKHQRTALVFDRKNPCSTKYKKVIQSTPQEEVKKPEAPRRGRKKNSVTPEPVERKVEESKPKKKVITKDDYF